MYKPLIEKPQMYKSLIGKSQMYKPLIGEPQMYKPLIGEPQMCKPLIGKPQMYKPLIRNRVHFLSCLLPCITQVEITKGMVVTEKRLGVWGGVQLE